MGTPYGALLGIVGTRPERMADGFAGPFHEGLGTLLQVSTGIRGIDTGPAGTAIQKPMVWKSCLIQPWVRW
jgi:hypothetical protein